jgi:uncharacterized protein (TIGR03437 family)
MVTMRTTGAFRTPSSLWLLVFTLTPTANAAATVTPIIEIVDTKVPAIESASIGVAVYGKPLSYTPIGTLTLKEGNTVLGTSSRPAGGIYVLAVPLTAPGPHVITAFYSGDANYAPGQSSPTTVQAVATTITLAPAGPPGLAFGVRAIVVGALQCIGSVTLAEAGRTLATKAIDVPTGTAEFLSSSYPQLTDGQHTIVASFRAELYGCAPATSSPLSVYIGFPTSVTEIVSITPNPSRFGQLPGAIVRVAAASGAASGRVTLKQGSVSLSMADLDATGLATVNLPSLPVGSWPVTAEYAGSALTRASISRPVTVVVDPAMIFLSAAGGQTTLAPKSLASAYGVDLAAAMASATTTPLPTNLNGVELSVPTQDGTAAKAQLLYVSPQQINFVVPEQSKTGSVTIQVSRGGQSLFADASIETVAPSIFTADGSASGPPLASLVTVHADGSQDSQPVYECSGGSCRSVELQVIGGETNVLVLYASGIRNAPRESVTARAASIALPVEYIGPQGAFAGLDQINLAVPAELAGRGAVTLEISAAGKSANPVVLRFR